MDCLSLPKEVLFLCFTYLSAKDLCSIQRVCWTFNLLALDDWLWRNLYKSTFGYLHQVPKDGSAKVGFKASKNDIFDSLESGQKIKIVGKKDSEYVLYVKFEVVNSTQNGNEPNGHFSGLPQRDILLSVHEIKTNVISELQRYYTRNTPFCDYKLTTDELDEMRLFLGFLHDVVGENEKKVPFKNFENVCSISIITIKEESEVLSKACEVERLLWDYFIRRFSVSKCKLAFSTKLLDR